MSTWPKFASLRGESLEVRVKAVPGAKRDEIVGVLGDRLKIRVAQPPEGGRANEAIRALLAAELGLGARAVVLTHGATSPAKTFVIACPDGSTAALAVACAKIGG